VTTDSPPETELTPAPKRPTGPRSIFVADFDDSDVGSSSNSYQVGSVDLDGRTYSRSSLPACYYGDTSTEFTLRRKWTQFSALVGIKDQSQSDYSATVTIYRDGNLWKQPLAVKVGSPVPIKIDMTGVLKRAGTGCAVDRGLGESAKCTDVTTVAEILARLPGRRAQPRR
jgi:hypothetical protein